MTFARIEAVITLSQGTDRDEVGKCISTITQAVIDAKDLVPELKKEIVDLIEALSEQIIGAQGATKPSVVKSLIDGLEKKIGSAAGLTAALEKLSSAIARLLGF